MKNDKQRSNTFCIYIYIYGGKSRGNGGAILWMFVPRIFQGAFFEMRLAREERSKILTDIRELSPPRTMRCHQSSSGKPTLIRERIFPPPRCLFIRAWSRMTLTRRKRIDVSTNTRVYSCTCIIYIYARFKSKSFSSLFETREFSSRGCCFFFISPLFGEKIIGRTKDPSIWIANYAYVFFVRHPKIVVVLLNRFFEMIQRKDLLVSKLLFLTIIWLWLKRKIENLNTISFNL